MTIGYWTSTPPVEPGWYIIANQGYATEVVHVIHETVCREKTLVAYCAGEDLFYMPNKHVAELWWSKPINLPVEPDWESAEMGKP